MPAFAPISDRDRKRVQVLRKGGEALSENTVAGDLTREPSFRARPFNHACALH
jgi:hypothetical protein